MTSLPRRVRVLGYLFRRALSSPALVLGWTFVLIGVAVLAGWESSLSLAAAQRSQAELAWRGHHLMIAEGAAGGWCSRADRISGGVLAAGAVERVAPRLFPSGVAADVHLASAGAVRALDSTVDVDGVTTLVGSVLEDELGWRVRSATSRRWVPAPPADFAGRAIIELIPAAFPATKCVLRFSGTVSPLQIAGLTQVLGEEGTVTARWQLPTSVEAETPLRDWYHRALRWMPPALGLLLGLLLGTLVVRAERVDTASLRLLGVPLGVVYAVYSLRAWLLSAAAAAGVIALGWGVHPTRRWAFASAGLTTLASSAIGACLVGVAVARSPWKALRYHE